MTITFKRFHASARLSEETVAYDTDVLFNGKPIGSCRNDGRGGQGLFRAKEGVDPNLLEQAENWARQQPYLEDDGSVSTFNGEPLIVKGIEEYCDLLAENTLAAKQEMDQLRRVMRKGTAFIDPTQPGNIFTIKTPYTGDAIIQALQKRHPGAIILNALPIDKALEAFREQVRIASQPKQATRSPQP